MGYRAMMFQVFFQSAYHDPMTVVYSAVFVIKKLKNKGATFLRVVRLRCVRWFGCNFQLPTFFAWFTGSTDTCYCCCGCAVHSACSYTTRIYKSAVKVK